MDYVDYDVWDGQTAGTSWEAVNRFLERSQQRQEARLSAELDRIDAQLDRRDTIHNEIVDELEWKIDRYTDQLNRLYRTNSGKQDRTRDQLKDQLDTFQQQLREEHRAHWRDRQKLERERRDILRELAELEETELSELL